jgi:uncharacterized protein YidB (DUF937 family)
MSRGYPSMTALLGLPAVAGYQNRDKIAEWLNAAQRKAGTLAQTSDASAASGLPANLSGILAGTSLSDLLSGGLRDLVNTFKQAGHGEAADSWVAPGPNKQIGRSELEQAIGPEVLETLSRQTGLSREEIVSRLSRNLPAAVDKYTPEGRIPTELDLSRAS